MPKGLFGQQLTVMEELRAATFTAHASLQTAPFFQATAACQLPLESFVGQLRALATLHGVLEQALTACSDERVAMVWRPAMQRVPLLWRDLQYFEPRTVLDLKEAVEATLRAADRLRLLSVEQPLSLLGCLYVLEGSNLGAVVLRPLFARAFLLSGDGGLAYLGGHGTSPHARWAQYQHRMNTLRLNDEERGQITAAAKDFFAALAAIFQALYPFQTESRVPHVSSINPEAGRHPVPADAREIQAALRAADACWQRFPYFEERYGERGRRFARSDAAWQATLCRFDLDQISQQVRWLGRILAARGMPTLLLQEQLEILVAELAAAIPEKRSEYAKLLPAAAELGESRRRHVPDELMHSLATEFDRSVGSEWSARLRHTGRLLAAAVADELGGNAGAIESLQTWMTSPDRFPTEWIAAVESTLAAARQRCRPAPGADTPRA